METKILASKVSHISTTYFGEYSDRTKMHRNEKGTGQPYFLVLACYIEAYFGKVLNEF